jgi:opacity protein-like surface antigen
MCERADCRKARRLRRHAVASGLSCWDIQLKTQYLKLLTYGFPIALPQTGAGAVYSRIAIHRIIFVIVVVDEAEAGANLSSMPMRKKQTMRSKSLMFVAFVLGLLTQSLTGSVLRAAAPPSDDSTRAGSTELTLFAGISAPVIKESTGFGLEIKTGTPIGGRVLYNFTNHNAVEFSIANPLSVSANYVYHFSSFRSRWVPYVTAGIGGARREIALSDNSQPAPLNSNLMETGPDRSQTAFTGNFGGGLKFCFTQRFALRFDARDQVGSYKGTFSNVAGVPGGIVRASKTLNDFQVTGGIVFRFGKG